MQHIDGSKNPDGTFAFLSAQNLLQVQQNTNVDLGLVDATDKNKLSVTYERMIPVLIKAIQELNAEIQTLKASR